MSGEETARSGAATPSDEGDEAQGGIGRGRTVDFERTWREWLARWEFDKLGVHHFGGDDEEAKRVWREERARTLTYECVHKCRRRKRMVKDYDHSVRRGSRRGSHARRSGGEVEGAGGEAARPPGEPRSPQAYSRGVLEAADVPGAGGDDPAQGSSMQRACRVRGRDSRRARGV